MKDDILRSKHTDKCNVVFHIVTGEAWKVRKTSECGDSGEYRVGLIGELISFTRASTSNTYLSSTISRQGIVPQRLVWTCNWSLVGSMVTVSQGAGGESGDRKKVSQHDGNVSIDSLERRVE